MLTEAQVCQAMSMKASQITNWYEMDEGTLVVTSEGAQTLIHEDGSTSPVFPRVAVPSKGGGADRYESKGDPIKVTATVGKKA